MYVSLVTSAWLVATGLYFDRTDALILGLAWGNAVILFDTIHQERPRP